MRPRHLWLDIARGAAVISMLIAHTAPVGGVFNVTEYLTAPLFAALIGASLSYSWEAWDSGAAPSSGCYGSRCRCSHAVEPPGAVPASSEKMTGGTFRDVVRFAWGTREPRATTPTVGHRTEEACFQAMALGILGGPGLSPAGIAVTE